MATSPHARRVASSWPSVRIAVILFISLTALGCAGPAVGDADSWQVDPSPPAELEEAVYNTLNAERCVTATQAERELQALLDQFGYREWRIRWDVGVSADDGCVGATLVTPDLEIRLIQALHPNVIAALDEVRAELYEKCLGQEDAIALVQSTLRALGETDADVQTGGPVAWPLDRREEIESHVEAGCFIYSTIGYTAEGHRIYYVAGPQN